METVDRVIEIIKKHIDSRIEVNPSTLLSDDDGIGSFDQLMILNAIEDEFKMEFTSNDLEQIKSVGDIANIMKKNYPAKN